MPGHHARPRPADRVRRGRGRGRPGRPRDRGLCRLRGPLGHRARPARVRRTGRSLRPDRELSWLSDWHLGPGLGWARVHPGAEIRRRDRHSARGGAARLRWRRVTRRDAAASGTGGWTHRAGAHRSDRVRRALSPAGHLEPVDLRGCGHLVLGLPGRSQAVRGRRGGADRRRQLGGGRPSCTSRPG